jgi:hypothetical protein
VQMCKCANVQMCQCANGQMCKCANLFLAVGRELLAIQSKRQNAHIPLF